MNRETAIGMILFLLFALVIGMAAPVVAESIAHAQKVTVEAMP